MTAEIKPLQRYAVIGNPIEHSKSPEIHAMFAEQTGQQMEYTKILGDTEHFRNQVRDFITNHGYGLNVTVPFKEQAWQMVDEHHGSAKLAGAVNTIVVADDHSLLGANTDGVGLARDLTQNHRLPLTGKNILILGAGGATRGILSALLEKSPSQITIANRTELRAETLAGQFAHYGPVSGIGLNRLPGKTYDLIINATSAGLSGEIPAIPDSILHPGGSTYDLMYSDKPTAFVRWGRERGAYKSVDGLGMLVEQAAESFFLWRNVRPDTQAVLEKIRPGFTTFNPWKPLG